MSGILTFLVSFMKLTNFWWISPNFMNCTKFNDFLLFSDPRPRPIWAVKPTQGLQNVVFSIGNGSSGELGGAQGSSGELRGAQGRSGALRGAQGSSASPPSVFDHLSNVLEPPPPAAGGRWSAFGDIWGALLEPFSGYSGSPCGVHLEALRGPF